MGLAMVLWVCLLGWEALACWEIEHLPLETERELGSEFLELRVGKVGDF